MCAVTGHIGDTAPTQLPSARTTPDDSVGLQINVWRLQIDRGHERLLCSAMDTTTLLEQLAEACLQQHELNSEPSFAVATSAAHTAIASFTSWPRDGVPPPEDLGEVSSAPRPLTPEDDFAFPILEPILEIGNRWQPTRIEPPSTFSFPEEHVADSSWETLQQHPCKLRPVHCAH